MAKPPVLPVPGGLRLQPVDAREVAARLVYLALGERPAWCPDLAGPTVYGLGELMRGYLATYGNRLLMVPVRIPGKAGRALSPSRRRPAGRSWPMMA